LDPATASRRHPRARAALLTLAGAEPRQGSASSAWRITEGRFTPGSTVRGARQRRNCIRRPNPAGGAQQRADLLRVIVEIWGQNENSEVTSREMKLDWSHAAPSRPLVLLRPEPAV
jgi:hypothetical protein